MLLNFLNNSFVRALILLLITIAMFELAKTCGASDVRSELIALAGTIGGAAVGAMQHNEKSAAGPQPGNPTQPSGS